MSRRSQRLPRRGGWATDEQGRTVSTVLWSILDASMTRYLRARDIDAHSEHTRLLRGIVRGNAQAIAAIVDGLSVKNAEMISKRRVVGED